MPHIMKPCLTLSEKHEMEHFKESIEMVEKMAREDGFDFDVHEDDYQFSFNSKDVRDLVMSRLAVFFDQYK